jgi:hypothetical protein
MPEEAAPFAKPTSNKHKHKHNRAYCRAPAA